MKKYIVPLLAVILLALGGFYLYTQSGEVLDEQAPTLTNNEISDTPQMDPNKPLLNERKMRNMIPDEPAKEPELPKETQEKINAMVKQGQMTEMTAEEESKMETETVAMMKASEEESSPTEVNMMTEEEMKEQFISRQGMFTEIDLIHKGSGLALIYPETAEGPILRLQDFSVTRGPDLHVYLSRNENITSSDQLGAYHDLGLLKSSKGNQNYQLPSNHSGFKSVVIWCQAFGVLFSSATLQP